MSSLKLALFVLFTLAARSSEAILFYTCGPCTCYDDVTGLKVAWCSVLTTVPGALPDDIQHLYVSGGSTPRLSDNQFTSYRRLQQIQIISNQIEQIEPESFRYMTSVTYIDLRSNKISEFPTECFTFAPNLVTVDLTYNKITRLQSNLFSCLKFLKNVYLTNNEIVTVEEHCFTEVPQLETIHLFNNKLISLDIKFIDNLSSLKVLSLDNNTWHCNTSLCGVMDTVVSRELWGSWSVPTCATPQNLTTRKWSKPLVTELCSCLPYNCINIAPEPRQPQPSCDAPRIISNTSSVVWTFNDAKLPSNYVEKSEESLTSTLTIKNILKEQRGYYLCKIRSCEDCEDAGVYVSVTGKPQSDVDLKQVVHVSGANSSESCGSRRGLLLLQYTVVPATELNTTLNDKN